MKLKRRTVERIACVFVIPCLANCLMNLVFVVFSLFLGERCVHLAAEAGHIDILRILVSHGADINARVWLSI